jgi:hypothetical protein
VCGGAIVFGLYGWLLEHLTDWLDGRVPLIVIGIDG